MMYDTLLARSFSKQEKKKLGYGALVASFLMALSFFSFFKPYSVPLQVNLQLSVGTNDKLQMVNDTIPSMLEAEESVMKNIVLIKGESNFRVAGNGDEIKNLSLTNDTSDIQLLKGRDVYLKSSCNSMERSDFCELNGDIRVDGKTGTIFVISSSREIEALGNTTWKIRPYGRKGDLYAMNKVREWTVKPISNINQYIPKCTRNHTVPGILFSVGGYSGNHFHAFADIIVPLFATSRPLNGEVQFLITDQHQQPKWVSKFEMLLKGLSRYEFVKIDDKKGDILCFPSVRVGLKHRSRKELSIEPTKSTYNMRDFTRFLRSVYSLRKNKAIRLQNWWWRKPRLMIISRMKSRAFTNNGEINKMARSLGFNTIVVETNDKLTEVAQVINSCDVVLGVHGAGLTNVVFLPENAILIQVVPFGGAEWLSSTYFEQPLKDMGLRYLDYKINLEESTLIKQYPHDHVVLRDPNVIKKQGWEAYRRIYMEKQNITLDVKRFRPTLTKALELLHQ